MFDETDTERIVAAVENSLRQFVQTSIFEVVPRNLPIVKQRNGQVQEYAHRLGTEYDHDHLGVAVGTEPSGKIDLTAYGQPGLLDVEFRNIERCPLVKDDLRTTDRNGQNTHRPMASECPIVPDIRL